MHFGPILLTFYSLSLFVSAKIDHQDVKHIHKTATKPRMEAANKHIDLIDMRKSYTELFKGKRRDQLGAIESIVNIEESKRRRYVEEVVKNVKDILKENRETLERIGHAASEPYPHDSETLTNAISKVLENIAFFSDLSLRFPFLEKVMQKDRKLRTDVVWAYNYAKETGLCDADTYKILEMMAQQQGIIPKSEKFVNPYDKEQAKKDLEERAAQEQERRAKEKDTKITKKKKKSEPKAEL